MREAGEGLEAAGERWRGTWGWLKSLKRATSGRRVEFGGGEHRRGGNEASAL